MSTSPASRTEPLPAWRPSASPEVLALRAGLAAKLRGFFAERGLLEVETPALSAAAVTDVHLESLVVARADGPRAGFLHTSPEFCMKRLLAAGVGDCWQLARVFRGGESGRRHNTEFSLLEWYRLGYTIEDLMGEVAELVACLADGIRPVGPPERMTYREAFQRHAGVDPFCRDPAPLADALQGAGVAPPQALADDPDACLGLLLSTVVEPALGPDRPTFIHDFPASQAALARIRPGDPPVAERFELFLGGVELANGFRELADPVEQVARFRDDLARRRSQGLPEPPMDERFIAALEAGLPDCSGVALGFDRLLMVLAGAASIRDVLAFPADQA